MNEINDNEIDWQVDVNDGKYTVRCHKSGKLSFLRYGEEWAVQNEVNQFSKMIYCLAYELNECRSVAADQKISDIRDGIRLTVKEGDRVCKRDQRFPEGTVKTHAPSKMLSCFVRWDDGEITFHNPDFLEYAKPDQNEASANIGIRATIKEGDRVCRYNNRLREGTVKKYEPGKLPSCVVQFDDGKTTIENPDFLEYVNSSRCSFCQREEKNIARTDRGEPIPWGWLLAWKVDGARLVFCEFCMAHRVRLIGDGFDNREVRFDLKELLTSTQHDPTLLDALTRAAIWETERAVQQALRGIRDPLTGQLWDTFFKFIFKQVIQSFTKQRIVDRIFHNELDLKDS